MQKFHIFSKETCFIARLRLEHQCCPLPCSVCDRGKTDVGSQPWTRYILWAVESRRTMRVRSRYQGWMYVDSQTLCRRNGALTSTYIWSWYSPTDRAIQVLRNVFFWKFDTHPPPLTLITLNRNCHNAFFWKFDTPHLIIVMPKYTAAKTDLHRLQPFAIMRQRLVPVRVGWLEVHAEFLLSYSYR